MLTYLLAIQITQADARYNNDIDTRNPVLAGSKPLADKAFDQITLYGTLEMLFRYRQTQAVVV
jgi:hypothetical protein